MTSKRLLISVLAIDIVLAATTVRAAPLPERTPPSGFASVNGPASGRTLAGTFTGNARSAAVVLGGMLGALRVPTRASATTSAASRWSSTARPAGAATSIATLPPRW